MDPTILDELEGLRAEALRFREEWEKRPEQGRYEERYHLAGQIMESVDELSAMVEEFNK